MRGLGIGRLIDSSRDGGYESGNSPDFGKFQEQGHNLYFEE
jgi:hypothetical protein